MANHRLVSFTRIASMYVSLTPAAQAGARSEVNAKYVDQRFAKGETAGLIADQRAKDVAGLQHDAKSGADRLLPLAQVDATGNFPGAPKAGQFFFGRPRQQHPIEGVDVFFPGHRGNYFPLWLLEGV